jgi:hypothetical protein
MSLGGILSIQVFTGFYKWGRMSLCDITRIDRFILDGFSLLVKFSQIGNFPLFAFGPAADIGANDSPHKACHSDEWPATASCTGDIYLHRISLVLSVAVPEKTPC